MPDPDYKWEDISLYCGDNISIMQSLAPESISLTVTSPPYDSLRQYTNDSEWSFDKFKGVAAELYRITVNGGVVVWNVADQTIEGSETGSSFRQALHFIDCGFKLADTMIYKKANPGGARGSNKTYLQCFEYMFVLSKGPIQTYNLLQDRPNKGARNGIGGGGRNPDGTIKVGRELEAFETGRRLNIWEYPTQINEWSGQHPAPFPIGLAEDHILSWSNEGDVVLDPFSGSGTTVTAALKHRRKAIGIDVSTQYTELARDRVQVAMNEKDSLAMFGL